MELKMEPYQVILLLVSVMIVSCVVIYAYILYKEAKNKAWLNKRSEAAKISYSLKKYKFLYKIQCKIAYKLAITNTGSKQENEQYAVYVMAFIVGFAVISMFMWASIIKDIWLPHYMGLLLAIGIIIPWMFFNIYYEIKLSQIIKQLPQAIDEFASSYRKSNKMFNALKDSYLYMPKTTGKEFERLYKSYNIDFEEGIRFFKERIKNDWAGIFASLLLINYSQGGSIIAQLDDLNTEIENDIMAKDKTRSKMMGFKMMSLGSLVLVVGAIYANMTMSESAKDYYMNVVGQNEIILTLAVTFIIFLCMLIVEKL